MNENQQLIDETLEIMRLLDSTVEYGDCILWTGAVSAAGYGIFKKHGCGCKLVRREMFALTKGKLSPREPIATTCDERLCINPSHLFQSSVHQVALKAGANGAFSSLARRQKIAKSKRKTSKLSIEIAREIRMSQESGPILSARYGVDRSLINNIKRGRVWQDYSNPFMALMK